MKMNNLKHSLFRNNTRTALKGLTLIEVLASLVILSAILTSVIITKAKVTKQWAIQNNRSKAMEAADTLLMIWWKTPNEFPRNSSGELKPEKLLWKTATIPCDAAENMMCEQVRLEIFDAEQSSGYYEPLTRVDVLLPKPKEDLSVCDAK